MELPVEKRIALLSVYNKGGIVEFAQALIDMGWELLSSGGTAAKLKEAGLEVTDTAEWIGGGAILGHKVVTLSRKLHAELLADLDSPEDMEELKSLELKPIHLVCVDFYPLSKAISSPNATQESVVESTDIGGPTMIRSAAKGRRITICRPQDRESVINWLRNSMPNSESFITNLVSIAESTVAEYCMRSAMYHGRGSIHGIVSTRVRELSKGENGPQSPAIHYTFDTGDPLALDQFKQIDGPASSFVTTTDIDRALQTITHMAAVESESDRAFAVAVKHGNPCGASWHHKSIAAEVLQRMIEGNPRAVFGGLVLTNIPVNEELAHILLFSALPKGSKKRILAAVVAPEFTPEAFDLLSKKGGKRCGLWVNPALADIDASSLDSQSRIRYIRGGILVQPNYTSVLDLNSEHVVIHGKRLFLPIENDLRLAWAIGSTSNSNTITLVKDGTLIGNGVGQQDRVGAAELAVKLARESGHDINGAIAYSDSFFPFTDGPEVLADAGVIAILASSGSRNDGQVIKFCEQRGVTLYMVPDKFIRGFYNH